MNHTKIVKGKLQTHSHKAAVQTDSPASFFAITTVSLSLRQIIVSENVEGKKPDEVKFKTPYAKRKFWQIG